MPRSKRGKEMYPKVRLRPDRHSNPSPSFPRVPRACTCRAVQWVTHKGVEWSGVEWGGVAWRGVGWKWVSVGVGVGVVVCGWWFFVTLSRQRV